MISDSQYRILYSLIGLVYVAGLFAPLFENDSAQFAVMAMRMVQENDFISLIKGPEEYLDKPHLHYWLAALSYLMFGIEDWAYRIPALLATALGAYSCYGLGRLFYGTGAGRLAALIFLSSQTIVLAGIDVRTDAVLTGFTAFALWQLVCYVEHRSPMAMVLGALGAALAFSAKGQIALVVIALPLLCHLAYTRKWPVLWRWETLLGLLVFALAISPVLYAYYQQFDLHPEKVIRGRDNRSGILFILWEQSFERLSGEGVGKNSSDYLFFFHTFLWVFLPWTFIGLAAFGNRFMKIWFGWKQRAKGVEALTTGGITLIFLLISFAQFKLPHYLNITIPLFAVLTAGYLNELPGGNLKKSGRWLHGIQAFIYAVVLVFCLLVISTVFTPAYWPAYAIFLLLAGGLGLLWVRNSEPTVKIILLAVLGSFMLNVVLNLHFYPRLLEYQGGSAMARVVEEKNIDPAKIYKISERHTWALDFYNREPVTITQASALEHMRGVWVYADEKERKILREKGLKWEREYAVDQFRITRLQMRFLNPATRSEVLNKMYLIHLE